MTTEEENAAHRKHMVTGPWKCFHCGEVIEEYHDAKMHFGEGQEGCEWSTPACILKEEKPLVEYMRMYERNVTKIWDCLRQLEE